MRLGHEITMKNGDNLHDRKSAAYPWNALLAQEKDTVFEIAALYPE